MIDFVVSGSRGFIGRSTFASLRHAGCLVATDHEFESNRQKARFFVNCANVAESPSASVALLRRKLELGRARAQTFVHMQSFVTLHGDGELDASRVNCGKHPRQLSLYAAGKLAQERLICREYRRRGPPHIILLYLPAVLGDGGSWTMALEQARKFGYALPPELEARARPNRIEVDDIAKFLIEMKQKPPAQNLERVILNSSASEADTWPNFLGRISSRSTVMPRAGRMAMLKQRVLALAFDTGILVPAERVARKLIGRGSGRANSADPQHELRFYGLIRHIVATQPYIPPGSGKY